MAQVIPSAQKMDRETLVARFGDLVAEEGAHEFATMKDGWKIHRETFTPSGPAKAVLVFAHGNGESTRTIGIRRLAHACVKRGIILETFDSNGHGESLEKNGKLLRKKAFRGQSFEPWTKKIDHLVEIAEIVVKQHKLPLIIGGHSGGGAAACTATDRIIAICEDNSVPFLTALYLSPGLEAMKSNAPCGLACCHSCIIPCCWFTCCCNCCGQPCLKVGPDGSNPKGALGEDNTLMYMNCDICWPETLPYAKGGGPDLPAAVSNMARLKSGQGLVFYGSKDEPFVQKLAPKLGEQVPAITVDIRDGLKHTYLNYNKDGDRTSCETIDHIFVNFVDTKLAS